MNPEIESRFAGLEKTCEATWQSLLAKSNFVQAVLAGEFDKRLYAIYLIETYHYTLHNARNQALVGVRGKSLTPDYMRFCFKHAQEETGHELMALNDLFALGLEKSTFGLPEPLPATETLIAYLYWVSVTGNPLRRLGYSFWAENCYGYIDPVIKKMQTVLGLEPKQMSFLVAHAKIDEVHAAEVQRLILKNCKDEKDWRDLETVMVTSLRLTGNMLEEVFDEYKRLCHQGGTKYDFLNSLMLNPTK